MDRREFLHTSASFLLGSLFGFNRLSPAFACNDCSNSSIALIIDDIGPCANKARQFLDLNIPLTFSILPRDPKSEELAHEIHAKGHEIMLHQPMEPYDSWLNPGPGALYVGDELDKILNVMEENISSIPHAKGVNNHMGSRFTASQKDMQDTLEIIKERGLFFVDSLTCGNSKGYDTAKRLNMPAAYRNIFLDNQINELAILYQLKKLNDHAIQYGHAIGIGHPHPETARAIGLFLRAIKNSSINLVPISSFVFTG
jgi:polysaccharide deacetylase 2 family uncharacterized protein YibQ